MTAVKYSVHGASALLELDNPPVNSMGHAMRVAVADALTRAADDPGVCAIVLTGNAKTFCAGADISEFGSPSALAAPNLRTLCALLENSVKPTIAAVNGVAMGGGLELALSCHYRVVAAGAQIALPEVKLGLLPGAGGTQRLPRLVGLERALNMVVSGQTVRGEELAGTALVDELAAGDAVPAALTFAARAVGGGLPTRKVAQMRVAMANADAFIAFARTTVAAVAGPFPAPLKCVAAVAASLKPFAEGLRIERELFESLLASDESRALRHAFFAERAASKIPDVPADTPTRDVRSVAIIGAGTMGGGIAMSFANAGIPVRILELKPEALAKGLATMRGNYENSARKGRLTAAQVEERMGLIRGTLSYDDIGDADLVIEAVFEDLDVKEQVFRKLDAIMKRGAILASNTSTLDLNKLAAFTKRPEDVIGLHFFSPANVMRLLEIVRGARTGKDVLITALQVAKRIRKIGVVSGVCDGFIGNRMLDPYFRQAGLLLDEGALPQQVDKAMERFGFAMGPFRVSDLAGNDISWAIRKRRRAEKAHSVYSAVPDRVCELGRFGQKTSAGYYDYKPGDRTAYPSPVVEKLILEESGRLGLTRRRIDDTEIVERLVYALVNEGAKILEEGIALRASDIDLVYLTGYGFPGHRGGPLLYADAVGLPDVVRAMTRYQRGPAYQRAAEAWRPARLLADLAARGAAFNP